MGLDLNLLATYLNAKKFEDAFQYMKDHVFDVCIADYFEQKPGFLNGSQFDSTALPLVLYILTHHHQQLKSSCYSNPFISCCWNILGFRQWDMNSFDQILYHPNYDPNHDYPMYKIVESHENNWGIGDEMERVKHILASRKHIDTRRIGGSYDVELGPFCCSEPSEHLDVMELADKRRFQMIYSLIKSYRKNPTKLRKRLRRKIEYCQIQDAATIFGLLRLTGENILCVK